jgi:tRNA pseudouridine55 synthase
MKSKSIIFGVYKPEGPTSNEIVNLIKKISGFKKVGHGGTLDPLAKGVLVVAVGREATKNLKNIVGAEKEYIARIKLGQESTTDDREGEKKEIRVSKIPGLSEIKKTISLFEGKIHQKPPLFSAVKIKGREAYKLARKGVRFEPKARLVEIKKIELLGYSWPYLDLKIRTGPGVYIRSLARDIGKKLKTGGYLFWLERVRVGDFKKEEALKLSQLEKFLKENLKNRFKEDSS